MIIEELKEFESEQKGDTLVFSDIPNPVYHAGVGISSSKIRAFGKSQLHAVEKVQETTPTPAPIPTPTLEPEPSPIPDPTPEPSPEPSPEPTPNPYPYS